MTEVFGSRPGLNPTGQAKQYDQSVLPLARSTYADQAPRRFHIGVFPVHTSGGGRQTLLMLKPAACNIPELFTCAKPPRHARNTTS
jgi:hypothetical protein